MEENDYTIIDQFLQGELPKDQHTAFHKRLATDKEFAKAYQFAQQMTNYLKARQKQPALEAKLNEWGDQYIKKETATSAKRIKMSSWKTGLAIAAAIALLLMVWNPFDSGDLYSQYAVHPPLALVEKNAASTFAQQAEQAYTSKNYVGAYSALTNLLEIESENVQAQLALGISALETGKTSEAQAIFSKLAEGTSVLKSYGQWYLALSYIQQGENEKAKPILKGINNDEPSLKKKATELLTKI